MGADEQLGLVIENCSLSEDEFYKKLLDYFDEGSFYYIIPDWLTLKLNKFGDSGISRGEIENREMRRKMRSSGGNTRSDTIELLNITGWQTRFGSYNYRFSVVKANLGYEIKGQMVIVPNINLLAIIPVLSFILSFIIFPRLILLATIGFPLLYWVFSRNKLLSDIDLPRKKLDEFFTGFKNTLRT